MRNRLFAATALSFAVFGGGANATPSISASTSPSFSLADLSSLAAVGSPGFQNSAPISFAGGTITFTNLSGQPNAGVYQGTVITAKTPYPGAAADDPRNYLVAQSTDDVVFHFDDPQTSFSLLWGTVDTYNNLSFQFDHQTVTGTDVAAAAGGGFSADGSTPLYVSISGLDSFTTLTVVDVGQPAFEFVPGALLSVGEFSNPVPEPASLALLGVGLLGVGFVTSRKRSA